MTKNLKWIHDCFSNELRTKNIWFIYLKSVTLNYYAPQQVKDVVTLIPAGSLVKLEFIKEAEELATHISVKESWAKPASMMHTTLQLPL